MIKCWFAAVTLGLMWAVNVNAGFLEMPDTSEVPEYERESMLLDLDIPPVRDRDPDPEAGPRLNVTEFRLQGLVEFPKLGITREAIIKKVEEIRFDVMKEGEVTDSGYTLSELGEVADLVAEIEKETEGEHVGPLEVQRLVFLIRDQRRRRGITLGMIETVADTITRYYRERGFILAKAYIPQQQVRDGVVTLTLLLGELGEVAVENNNRTSTKQVRRIFKPDIHKPVTNKSIEEKLFLVNDIPGVSAQGFFSPGSQVGDTKLNVNVLEEEWYTSNVRIDNHGFETTGQNRAYVDFTVLNPLTLGDELYLSLLRTFDPSNTTYGAFRYKSFLGHPRWRGAIGMSSNDFFSIPLTEGASELRVEGESVVSDLALSYIFRRSRVSNYSASLEFQNIKSELTNFFNGDPAAPTEEEVENARLRFNFDILNERSRRLHIGNVSLNNSDGVREDDGSTEGARKSAPILNVDYSMLSFWTVPVINADTRILFKTSIQYSGETLLNVNQMSIAGPTKARAFSVDAPTFDDAIYVGADWFFNLPGFGEMRLFGESVNRVIQPYVFFDAAYGVVNDSGSFFLSDKIVIDIADVGIGLNFNAYSFRTSLTYAKSLGVNVDEPSVVGQESSADDFSSDAFFIDMQYTF